MSLPTPDNSSLAIPSPQFNTDLDLTQVQLPKHPLVYTPNTKRLLIILPWMVMGGAERFILNLIDQLNQRGWQIDIVCTSPAEQIWQAEFTRRAVQVVTLPELMPIRDYLPYLSNLILENAYAALLLQGSQEGYRLLPALRGIFPSLPILDYLHFVTPDWMNGGFPRLSVLYRDGLDFSITSCGQLTDWMIKAGADTQRIKVSPIGVDPSIWHADPDARTRFRQQHGIPDDAVVILFAARLEEQKNPFLMVDTLHRLAQENISFRALVAGDGSLRKSIQERIDACGLLDQVQCLGSLDSADMPSFLAAGDIFFLPSRNEGISSAIYEAMASGLVIIGANVGGQAELVTPQCGFLLSDFPQEELSVKYADVLAGLIKDADMRTAMGLASRKRILENFTLNQMGTTFSAILDELIRRKASGELPCQIISPEERFTRDTQHVVEYLQARQEWHTLHQRHDELMAENAAAYAELSNKYFELIQPKPASHWFYLWIRQLFLPVFTKLQGSSFFQKALSVKEILKKRLLHR